MDTNGTNINDLIEKNKLSNEESSIVDSIVDELITRGNPQSSQEKLPQISEEEKEMLIRQRNQQEQQKRQYQYQQKMQQQQHMQNEIHRQQMQQQKEMLDLFNKNKEDSPINRIKQYILKSMDIFIVFILTILFNTESFSNFLKFKSVPFFYDVQTDKSKFSAIILKSLLLAITFGTIKYFLK